jgi:putative transposase
MGHTYTNLLTHMIFSTKERRPFLDAPLKKKLFPYLGGIIRNLKGSALAINGPTDHVHILMALPPTIAIADAASKIKSNSSGWVHDEYKLCPQFKWQVGYGGFSVSESNVEAVKKYIADQEEHHKTMTFKEEFVAFLKKNKIKYDDRYIWD